MQEGCLSSLGTSSAGRKHPSCCHTLRLSRPATPSCRSASVRVNSSTESAVTRRRELLRLGAVLVCDLCLRSAASSAVDQSDKKAIEVCLSLEQPMAYYIATWIQDAQMHHVSLISSSVWVHDSPRSVQSQNQACQEPCMRQ